MSTPKTFKYVRPVEEFMQAREGECDRFGFTCFTHDEGVMWPENDVCELIRHMTNLVRARDIEVVEGAEEALRPEHSYAISQVRARLGDVGRRED